jgi:beta-xylosidase
MSAARARILLGCVLVAFSLLLSLTTVGSASARDTTPARGQLPAPVGSDKFATGGSYRGDFPDPAVLRVGTTYYAYSTTVSSLNLPVVASTDLVHWRALGEGLKRPARWALTRKVGKRLFARTWAPSVARFGNRYVHAYATPAKGAADHRMCISISTSKKPWGRFVDRTRRPFLCPANRGAIDPQFFTAPNGLRYLLWKSEQTATYPSQLWSTRISQDGSKLFSTHGLLLTTQQPWEGRVIENPSMIAYAGRYYLFYSGGSYANSTYATGYATCRSPLGPCTRASAAPLLATGAKVAGPGGAMAFLDVANRLHLAYAAWDYANAGYPKSTACLHTAKGCPQRRLHIASLRPSTDRSGALVVTSRG